MELKTITVTDLGKEQSLQILDLEKEAREVVRVLFLEENKIRDGSFKPIRTTPQQYVKKRIILFKQFLQRELDAKNVSQ